MKHLFIRVVTLTALCYFSCGKDDNLVSNKGATMPTLLGNSNIILSGILPANVQINLSTGSDTARTITKNGTYYIWERPLSAFNYAYPNSHLQTDTFPSTVQITFAISEDKSFYVGAKGDVPAVLSVVSSFYALDSLGGWGGWDAIIGPSNWALNWNGIFVPCDIGLAGIAYREFTSLQAEGKISGMPISTEDFHQSSAIRIKQQFTQNITVIYYSLLAMADDRGGHIAALYHQRWCPFASAGDNGTATRTMRLSFTGASSSFLYATAENNNNESSWIQVNGTDLIRQINWGQQAKKICNIYPDSITLGGNKTWSEIDPAIGMAILGGSVKVLGCSDSPGLGQRPNPPPDILILEPGVWYP